MGKIIFIRGKAATGKSLIANLLSKKMRAFVLRKDDIYDSISNNKMNHSDKNQISYKILANLLQTSINNNNNTIVDFSLYHNQYLYEFLKKINTNNSSIYHILCTCSNNLIWESRLKKRFKNPSPNQLFKSVKEARDHYNNLNCIPLDDEVLIDSSNKIELIIEKILQNINE